MLNVVSPLLNLGLCSGCLNTLMFISEVTQQYKDYARKGQLCPKDSTHSLWKTYLFSHCQNKSNNPIFFPKALIYITLTCPCCLTAPVKNQDWWGDIASASSVATFSCLSRPSPLKTLYCPLMFYPLSRLRRLTGQWRETILRTSKSKKQTKNRNRSKNTSRKLSTRKTL